MALQGGSLGVALAALALSSCGQTNVAADAAPPCVMCGNACVDVTSDPQNCGSCGHDCEGAGCSAGACGPVPLATQLLPYVGAGHITTDDASVYWTNGADDGGVLRVSKDGGHVSVLAGGQNQPNLIAVDDVGVYWSTGLGDVMTVGLDGGPPIALATGAQPAALAVDGTNVFWTDPKAGTVMMVPRTGGNATAVASSQAGPGGIAVDAVDAYWTNDSDGTVMVAPKSGGGTPTALVSGQSHPAEILVDSTTVYWLDLDYGTTSVMSVPKTGGVVQALAVGQESGHDLVADATSLFWIDYAPDTGGWMRNTVVTVDKNGGQAHAFSPFELYPSSIAVDGTSLYCATISQVIKIAKP